MPRRIDSNGQAVWTPQIGYRYEDKKIYSISLLKDCYDHFAGMLLIGDTFYKNKYFNLEWNAGIYIREAPYYYEDGSWHIAKDYPLPVQVEGAQFLPMGFVGIEFMPESRVRPVFFTNGFINNLSIKIEF